MTYEEARKYINDGDIIFIRGEKKFLKNPIRSSIMFFTNSVYVHTGIVFWANIAGHKHLLITEAQGGTSRRIVNMSFYETENIDVMEPLKEWNDISTDAVEKLGKVKYGWMDAFYVGLREKFYKIPFKPKNFSGEICSERVANLQGITPSEISPQKLYEILLKNGKKIKLQIRK